MGSICSSAKMLQQGEDNSLYTVFDQSVHQSVELKIVVVICILSDKFTALLSEVA